MSQRFTSLNCLIESSHSLRLLSPPFYSTDQIIPIFHKLNTPGLKTFFLQNLNDGEMPVSLQNNLSELDTLLADLNNAK